MKVAFVLPGGGISGGVRVTVIAANMLLEKGLGVRILCGKSDVTVRSLFRSVRDKLVYRAHYWLDDFRGEISYFSHIRECTFEPDEMIIGVGMWASKEVGQMTQHQNKKVQYIHGATPWEPGLMNEALSMPLHKIVVATYLQRLIESLNGGKVLAVVPNGVNRLEYYPTVEDRHKDGVGLIYSSHPAKDPDTVLAIIDKVRALRPTMPIRVFGADRMPKLPRGVAYKRLPSLAQARDIYSNCKVWILASRSEGFPAPVLEAMACGCVVVATDCGGPRDVIQNGENGFLVNVGDVDEIVRKALFLVDSDRDRLQLKSAADDALNTYTWENCANRLESALRCYAAGRE